MDRPAGTGRPDPARASEVRGKPTPAALQFTVPPWELVIRAVVIYVALLLALRLFGKREVGQFTLYDLVFILLVANALQPAITGPDTSVVGGIVLIVALVGVNYLVGKLDNMPRFHQLFTPAPAVIVKDGKYLPAVMKREGVDQAEVEMSMREHGVVDMKDVQLAVLEADGTISIVPTTVAMTRTKHRIRYHHRAG
jgi:uncharacterized membrane protein YcaP (DUF421 family)